MELDLRGEELGYESCETTVPQNSSNLHIRKFKWHGCISECVFISVLHLLTLSGRFRVWFDVGNISNMIEHLVLATLPGYLNYEPPQYVPEAT